MISIQGVSFTYPGSDAPVLRDLNLEVPQGAFTALVGNNGSGKTSLCKLLTGLIPHFFEGEICGSVTVNGQNTFDTRVSELSRHVGYVYQDLATVMYRAGLSIPMVNFFDGMNGGDITLDHIEKAVDITIDAAEGKQVEEYHWLALPWLHEE